LKKHIYVGIEKSKPLNAIKLGYWGYICNYIFNRASGLALVSLGQHHSTYQAGSKLRQFWIFWGVNLTDEHFIARVWYIFVGACLSHMILEHNTAVVVEW